MVSKTRAVRIAERVQQELTDLVLTKVSDPRVLGVTITDVTVDRELAFANVYVSSLDGSKRAKEILEGLNHAQGFLRSELSRRIDLRQFPKLRFHWDPTPENFERIDRLLDQIHQEDQDH